jgi:beta-1,4-N-acetylglucosaminyltransferase
MPPPSQSTEPRPAPLLQRHCFITIGATAHFTQLLTSALSPSFLSKLSEYEYTHLTLQAGPDASLIDEWVQKPQLQSHLSEVGLTVRSFDYNRVGLTGEMILCRKRARGDPLATALGEPEALRREGVVICHAGAGTVLDALRLSVPIIVVPNPSLLDDHQTELAEELESQGYVIHGQLEELGEALDRNEERVRRGKGRTWGQMELDTLRGDVCDVLDQEVGVDAKVGKARRKEIKLRAEKQKEAELRGMLD